MRVDCVGSGSAARWLAVVAAGLLGGACQSSSGTAGQGVDASRGGSGGGTSADTRAGQRTRGAPDVGTPGPVPDTASPPVPVADTSAPTGPVRVTPPVTWATDPKRVPMNIHMTWQRDPATTLTFQWATVETDVTGRTPRVWMVKKSELLDGELPMADELVTEGDGFDYQLSISGEPVADEVFVLWHVEVTGLQPYTEYAVRIGEWEAFDPATGQLTAPNLSDMMTVRTGRSKGSREPFDVVMAGDSRSGSPEIKQNIGRIAQVPADMWFFNGDMTEAGTPPEWAVWFDVMAPVLTRTVLMPVQGNHELFADLFYNQFLLPVAGPELPDALKEHAWSVDYGNVHFVGLDSNSTAAIQEQLAWLDADLAGAHADADIDWIIVMFHHAVYSASKHGSDLQVQQYFVPLFEKYGVDMVFTGHDHDYERTVPIREGQAVGTGEGVVYVVAGAFFSPAYGNGKKWFTAVSHHGDLRNYVQLRVDGKRLELTAWPGAGGPNVESSTPLDQYVLQK